MSTVASRTWLIALVLVIRWAAPTINLPLLMSALYSVGLLLMMFTILSAILSGELSASVNVVISLLKDFVVSSANILSFLVDVFNAVISEVSEVVFFCLAVAWRFRVAALTTAALYVIHFICIVEPLFQAEVFPPLVVFIAIATSWFNDNVFKMFSLPQLYKSPSVILLAVMYDATHLNSVLLLGFVVLKWIYDTFTSSFRPTYLSVSISLLWVVILLRYYILVQSLLSAIMFSIPHLVFIAGFCLHVWVMYAQARSKVIVVRDMVNLAQLFFLSSTVTVVSALTAWYIPLDFLFQGFNLELSLIAMLCVIGVMLADTRATNQLDAVNQLLELVVVTAELINIRLLAPVLNVPRRRLNAIIMSRVNASKMTETLDKDALKAFTPCSNKNENEFNEFNAE